jgi:lactoylglutathione lyase
MDSLGLRTTIYRVSDLHAAKEWYAKAFGFQPYFDEPFYVGFDISGFELGLLQEEGPMKKGENVIAYWGVEDIDKAYKSLIDIGATEIEKPTNVGGVIVVASVKDPWGNAIGIIFNPEFKIRLKKSNL